MRFLYTTDDVENKSVVVTIVACPFCCSFEEKGMMAVMFDDELDDCEVCIQQATNEWLASDPRHTKMISQGQS